MRIIYLFGIALCLSLTGCSRADLMKRFVPQEDEAAARQYVELLRQGKFDQIEQNLEPALVDPQERNTLATMAAMIPAGDPESVKVVGLKVTRGKDFSTTNLTLEPVFQQMVAGKRCHQEIRRQHNAHRFSCRPDSRFLGKHQQIQSAGKGYQPILNPDAGGVLSTF